MLIYEALDYNFLASNNQFPWGEGGGGGPGLTRVLLVSSHSHVNLLQRDQTLKLSIIILQDSYMSRRFRYDVLQSVDKSGQLWFYFGKSS